MSHTLVWVDKLWVEGQLPGGATLHLHLILAGNSQGGAFFLGEVTTGP